MSRHPPFLAVPIQAQISADGRLISADPPLWRLHGIAGGTDDGTVAVPGLAAIAALCLKTKMRIEQPVRVVDAENDVELWVEAIPELGTARLLITGWRDLETTLLQTAARIDNVAPKAETDQFMVDADLRIVKMSSRFGLQAVGKHFGSVFVVEGGPGGSMPVIDALCDRKDITNEPVSLIGQEVRCLLSLTPQFSQNGHFLGHAGRLALESRAEITAEPIATTAALPVNRQFASVLKQPLNRIVANAETIGSKMLGPLRDNYAEYAQDIANAARHLSELVADMEDLEAIDRVGFSVAQDRIELGDIARRVGGLLALKASDHGITLILPAEADKVCAIGEFRRVLQILLNLVGNAIRYAPDGSTVTLSAEKVGDNAVISVADQGNGIALDDRERIFEKFERLGRSGDGGSGLGLFISRKLAHAMAGELEVSDAPQGGALFRLTLPAI